MDAPKITEKIYITDELQKLLVEKKHRYAELYLLGKNEVGILTKAIHLKQFGGCGDMPGIPYSILSKAFVAMVKLELMPAAFAYRTSHEETLSYHDVNSHPDTPFICSTCDGLSAVRADTRNHSGKGRTSWNRRFEVCVVNEHYDPSLGRAQRRALASAKQTSATKKQKEPHRGNRKKR
jgi:hypothetical protein